MKTCATRRKQAVWNDGMRMSYRSMSGCVLAGWLPPAAAAAWLVGRGGERVELVAAGVGAGIALLVVLASGAVTARAGAKSAGQAALTFVMAGIVRTVGAAALAAGAWAIWKLPHLPLLLTMLACYAGAWGAECFWILKAIRKSGGGKTTRETEAKTEEKEETNEGGTPSGHEGKMPSPRADKLPSPLLRSTC
jgi:hypothetical protein